MKKLVTSLTAVVFTLGLAASGHAENVSKDTNKTDAKMTAQAQTGKVEKSTEGSAVKTPVTKETSSAPAASGAKETGKPGEKVVIPDKGGEKGKNIEQKKENGEKKTGEKEVKK